MHIKKQIYIKFFFHFKCDLLTQHMPLDGLEKIIHQKCTN